MTILAPKDTTQDQTNARIAKLSEQFPELAAQEIAAGRFRLTLANETARIWIEYHKAANVPDGGDQWRYVHSHSTTECESTGPYSHPTERGCWLAARRFLIANGYLAAPSDNSHLTPHTAKLVAEGTNARGFRAALKNTPPEVGDIIIDSMGHERRVCVDRCTGSVQTTTSMERSYYAGNSGYASFSGSCGQSVDLGRLTKGFKTRPALFWTFKDGHSGPGRGVDFWMPVLVWTFDGAFASGNWGEAA